MSLLKRSTSKRDKARRTVAKKAKSAKRSAKRHAPSQGLGKRGIAAVGGALAAVAGLFAIKKRKGSGDNTPGS